eukprot:TRINITY_DN5258_c0_g1_i8.p5 TRINITY_DN5258_c0_g1~~TRINITY_DN5258_c0_g1_i8.p5  ORF type:complete len:144 (-),score=8.47 TRINITY_DN5258_c0_g1_i8:209-640(-)
MPGVLDSPLFSELFYMHAVIIYNFQFWLYLRWLLIFCLDFLMGASKIYYQKNNLGINLGVQTNSAVCLLTLVIQTNIFVQAIFRNLKAFFFFWRVSGKSDVSLQKARKSNQIGDVFKWYVLMLGKHCNIMCMFGDEGVWVCVC